MAESNTMDSVSELIGLIKGMVADDEINIREFATLERWLGDHEELAGEWPANLIHERIRQICADNVVDDEELENLRDILVKIAET